MGYVVVFVVFAMLVLEGLLKWFEDNQSHRRR